ncbi:hypothetical protein MG293_014911 [Ovis ammon polii]|uniref:Uncharacterized protein n=1 Tax=Ovis ammon polii TaxID=230172 RepID=A0AAD4TVD4_OVIAM|nr:hypothetical protein MG293_014911 [Ovis ammon polii]
MSVDALGVIARVGSSVAPRPDISIRDYQQPLSRGKTCFGEVQKFDFPESPGRVSDRLIKDYNLSSSEGQRIELAISDLIFFQPKSPAPAWSQGFPGKPNLLQGEPGQQFSDARVSWSPELDTPCQTPADRTRGTANRAQRPRSRPHLRLWSDLAYRAKLGKGLSENQTRHLCKSADVFGRKLSTLYEASFSEETCHSAEHAVLLRLEPGRQEGSDKYCLSEAGLTTESFFMCLLCASINISRLRRQATVPDQAAR